MLLARQGHRVLLLDRATFPSDTMSTHLVHPPGVAALRRWGLLERLEATGCPPVETYSYDFGPLMISGSPRPVDGVARAYCPRRTVLDQLLVDAAVEAGAELREGFTVDELLATDGVVTGIRGHARAGSAVTERARVVIGADGVHSLVAKTVRPEQYETRPSRCAIYYAYWSDFPVGGNEVTIRGEHGRGWGPAPTHDGLTVLPFGWPVEEFKANRADVERHLWAALDLVPELAERVRAATRESRFVGSGDLPGYFRTPYGPGWALVGDAGYHKNPITALGISDAFRDAELVAGAISGRHSYEDYQRTRDRESMPLYELTDEFAQLRPPPPEMQQLFAAIEGDQTAMDDLVSVMAGTLAAPEFFSVRS
jgi:2-polyprenyl-6-methoxyphenol hydroxylase-like FAD-dependent oxidoreductase